MIIVEHKVFRGNHLGTCIYAPINPCMDILGDVLGLSPIVLLSQPKFRATQNLTREPRSNI